MNIYEALEKDHRLYESLLDRMLAASQAGDDQWKSLLTELRDDFIPHSHAEEAVFYNALRDENQAKELIRQGYAEHLKVETTVRALGAMKKIDLNGRRLIESLSDDLRNHIDKEEKQVFPAARQVFDDEEARKIGEAYQKLKPEMRKDATSVAASTIDLVANLLPTRLTDRFRKAFGSRKQRAA